MNAPPVAMTGETPANFLFRSFRILDAGDLEGWLELCTPDVSYVVTTSYNVARGYEVALIHDDLGRLKGRIASIRKYWHAEVPGTRTMHMVTNIETEPAADGALTVHSCFLVAATRLDKQWLLTGRYRDELTPHQQTWRLKSRYAVLDKEVLDGGKVTFIV